MPSNPFTKYQKYVDRPGRSSNDLSFDINSTYRLGTLYPAGIWEVNAGESFHIESAFGLKFLPMPYPVQTRMRANLYYYYVRNRNIYDGWKDFIYQNKSASEIPHPYITRPATDKDFWRTGGIMDHLGCPTTLVRKGSSGGVTVGVWGISDTRREVGHVGGGVSDHTVYGASYGANNTGVVSITASSSVPVRLQYDRPICLSTRPIIGNIFTNVFDRYICYVVQQSQLSDYAATDKLATGYCLGIFSHAPLFQEESGCPLTFYNAVLATQVASTDGRKVVVMLFAGTEGMDRNDFKCAGVFTGLDIVGSGSSYVVSLTGDVCNACSDIVAQGKKYFMFVGETLEDAAKFDAALFPTAMFGLTNTTSNIGNLASVGVFATNIVDLADYPAMNPFAGNSPALPLSALPLRVYESIYNAWFRNERLEPLMIDGVPEYNKFCPNTENGADSYPYVLHQRNWESDYLTTALPSPQQGIAPVVGVTALGIIQIDDDGTIRNFKAELAEDANTIVGGSFTDPASGIGAAARRTAQDLVTAGFTINDLRNVNALQRWLENNLRRGLKYRDQVLANTGVKVKYDELDMPEFIGGFSRPVQVSSVTQTAPGGEAGVGDYAGQASSFGGSRHAVRHYCDEAGFIMAVLCIVPEPVYSQNLPKYFLKQSPLDYFHPAFNHIGMQPITYSEVCPLQVFQADPTQGLQGTIKFNDVFGYQRPWYDLLARTNEVHGLMRTSMRNYVMNRTFDDVPELGGDFVHIDPAQINDVFTVTLPDQDVCMGQIIHKVYAKRMVSLFGQPKIQ